jgi:hypothetical protein
MWTSTFSSAMAFRNAVSRRLCALRWLFITNANGAPGIRITDITELSASSITVGAMWSM